MKLHEARYCPDCKEIFCNKTDGKISTDCPKCANRITVFLSYLFKPGIIVFDGLDKGEENVLGKEKNLLSR